MPVFQLTLDVSQFPAATAQAVGSLETIARAASSTRNAVGNFSAGFSTKGAQRSAGEFQDVLTGMTVSTEKYTALVLGSFQKTTSGIDTAISQMKKGFQGMVAAQDKTKDSAEKAAKAPLVAISNYQDLVQYADSFNFSLQEQNREIAAQAKYFKDVLGVSEQIVEEWRKAEQKGLLNQGVTDGISRGIRVVSREAADLAGQSTTITRNLAQDFESALTLPIQSFLETGEAGFIDFRSMFTSMMGDIFRMAAAKPITVSVVGVMGGILGGTGMAQAGGTGGGGGGGVNYGDAIKLGQNGLYYFGSSGLSTGAMSPVSFGGSQVGQVYPTITVFNQGGMSAINTPGITGVGQVYPTIPIPGTTPGAASSGFGTASTALGYLGSAVGGYFTGRGFYEGQGAKWGLPQGRETGWSSGVGGAFGGIGGAYLMSSAGLGITAALTGAATAAGGTAAGAAAGSVVPVIGTAIGAIVGAIAGGLAGSLGGKERELRVYTGMRTNLADSGAYIQTEQSQEGMADAFSYGSYTKADFLGDWGAINIKGSTGHSAYYVDPVHAGKKGDAVAAMIEPQIKKVEEILLEMAKSTTEMLPDALQKQFTEELRKRPLALEYKMKPGDLDQEGVEEWIGDWVTLTEGVMLESLQALDFSQWKDKIDINVADYAGFQMFVKAAKSIESVEEATKELTQPTSQFVKEAKEANAQLDAWALSLRQYGVTQEHAKEMMDTYKETSIVTFVQGFTESFSPLPAFAQALKTAGETLDGRIAGLRELGATEEQIMGLEVKRSEVLNLAVADLLRQTSQNYLQRYTALTNGDTEGIGAALARENELLAIAGQFGTGLDWTSVLLDKATSLNRQQYQDRTDWDVDSVKKAIADAGMNVETWYANFGKAEGFSPPKNVYEEYENLLAAEEEKRKLDTLKKSQEAYLNAQLNSVNALVNAWENVTRQLEATRSGLHTSSANVNLFRQQAAAQQDFEALYAKALAGDAEAAQELGSTASDLLALAKQTARNEHEYQQVFNDVDRKLFDANIYAGKEFSASQAQLESLNTANGLLANQVDLSAQILAQEKALEAALKNLAKPEYAPPGTGAPGTGPSDPIPPGGGSSSNGWMQSVLHAKADAMNRSEGLVPGQTPNAWTPDKVMESIITSGLTFDQWANTFGVAEGFVAGWDKVVAGKVAALNNTFGGGWNEARLLQAIKDSGMTPGEWYFHFGKAEGFASGGITPAGRPFWVGENGPELMMSPNQYGVLSNPESLRLAGSLAGSLSGSLAASLAQPASLDGPASLAVAGSLQAENQALRGEVRSLGERISSLVALTASIVRNTRDSADSLDGIKVEGLQTREYTVPPPVIIPFSA